jgi:histidyl-tRNA synthetase
MQSEKIKEEDRMQVIKEIDKLDKLTEKEVKENLKKYKAENLLDIFKKPESFFEKYKAYSEVQELQKYCNFYGINFEFSPTLARGLSYYNGTIFEFKSKEMKETIGAGGAYLVNDIQSIGVSFGLDRVSQLATKLNHTERGVVIVSLGQDEEAIKIMQKLREKGILSELWGGKGLSKALEYANSYNMPYVIFIGEEELKQKKVKLKN